MEKKKNWWRKEMAHKTYERRAGKSEKKEVTEQWEVRWQKKETDGDSYDETYRRVETASIEHNTDRTARENKNLYTSLFNVVVRIYLGFTIIMAVVAAVVSSCIAYVVRRMCHAMEHQQNRKCFDTLVLVFLCFNEIFLCIVTTICHVTEKREKSKTETISDQLRWVRISNA